MKEATGELNMTVIVVIAIAAIAALFYAFVWPMIQTQLATNTCKTFGEEYVAVRKTEGKGSTGSDKKQEETSATSVFPFVLGRVLNFVP